MHYHRASGPEVNVRLHFVSAAPTEIHNVLLFPLSSATIEIYLPQFIKVLLWLVLGPTLMNGNFLEPSTLAALLTCMFRFGDIYMFLFHLIVEYNPFRSSASQNFQQRSSWPVPSQLDERPHQSFNGSHLQSHR